MSDEKKTDSRAVTQEDLNNAKALVDGNVNVGDTHEFEVAEEAAAE